MIGPCTLALTLLQGPVLVEPRTIDPVRLELWRAAREERPVLRGFRAPILERAAEPLRLDLPAESADPRAAAAARTVAARLAPDGLRATLVAAIADLGPERVLDGSGGEQLEAIGFPVDLLAFLAPPEAEPVHLTAARDLRAGRPAAEVRAALDALPFGFRATVPGWRSATECGEEAAGALRLQLSSGRDYAAPGDGGTLDVFRQLARLMPDVPIVASVQSRDLEPVEALARELARSRTAAITLLPEPLPVSQWAQDGAKPGFVEAGGAREIVWMVPRYASRGEDGSTFVPGENLLLEGLAGTGRRLALSPLLFQGGNLLAVRDPRDGTRSMLVGEAELARNRSLGLSRDEVLDALRAEFGVDRCIVLPAVSFHVDLEVSVRAAPTGLTAFVLDTSRGARLAVRCGLDALERAGSLTADEVRLLRADLEADRISEFVARLGPRLAARQHGPGQFDEAWARGFSAGPADSGIGNLQRFLLGIDLWTAERMGNAGPREMGIDADSWAYLDSLRRREGERIAVATALAGLGWRIVAVPGTSDGARSVNPLNGLQLAGRYLQPAYGGVYAPWDDAARDVFEAEMGSGVSVIPVLCGETQRRSGGLHCAVAVEPRP